MIPRPLAAGSFIEKLRKDLISCLKIYIKVYLQDRNRSRVQWFRVHRNLNRPTSKANERKVTLSRLRRRLRHSSAATTAEIVAAGYDG